MENPIVIPSCAFRIRRRTKNVRRRIKRCIAGSQILIAMSKSGRDVQMWSIWPSRVGTRKVAKLGQKVAKFGSKRRSPKRHPQTFTFHEFFRAFQTFRRRHLGPKMGQKWPFRGRDPESAILGHFWQISGSSQIGQIGPILANRANSSFSRSSPRSKSGPKREPFWCSKSGPKCGQNASKK